MSSHEPPIRTGLLAIVTGLMFTIGPSMVDLSLPALPLIQQSIGTSALRAELSLTVVFLGLALAQLIFGAFADRWGRRRPLLIGMAGYCCAALAAAFAPDMVTFLIARLIQAVCYGVAIVLARSAVVDISDERSTARVFSTAIMFMALMSVIAPAVGGALLAIWSWRAIFLVMSAFGAIVMLAVAACLPETLSPERRTRLPVSRVFSTYGGLLRQGRFAACAIIGACAVTYQFTYNTGAPAVVVEHYGLQPATAGLIFSVIAISTALASQLNSWLLRWRTPSQMMSLGVTLSVVCSAVLLTNVLTGVGGVAMFVVTLFVLMATIGLIAANAMAGAISSAGHQAGAASALVGVVQFVFGTVSSAIVGVFHNAQGRPMALVIMALSLIALAISMRTRSQPSTFASV